MSLDIWLEMPLDTGGPEPVRVTLLDMNFTHNVTGMWSLIGVYDALYMSNGDVAGKHIEALERGVKFMLDHPDECRKHNAPNGWGTYEQALPWLQEVLDGFRKHPKATIRISK